MVQAVRQALQQCCLQVIHIHVLLFVSHVIAVVRDTGAEESTRMLLQLRVKIQKQMAIREQKARRKNLTKYIPNAAAAVFTVCAVCSTAL